MVTRSLALVAANANAIVFLVGFGVFCAGLSVRFSAAVAGIVGGLILMALSAWPFLTLTRGSRRIERPVV